MIFYFRLKIARSQFGVDHSTLSTCPDWWNLLNMLARKEFTLTSVVVSFVKFSISTIVI